MGRRKELKEDRKMRIKIYDSEFHALQIWHTIFTAPKKTKILITTNTIDEHTNKFRSFANRVDNEKRFCYD